MSYEDRFFSKSSKWHFERRVVTPYQKQQQQKENYSLMEPVCRWQEAHEKFKSPEVTQRPGQEGWGESHTAPYHRALGKQDFPSEVQKRTFLIPSLYHMMCSFNQT